MTDDTTAEEGPANYTHEALGRAQETIGQLRHELSLLKSEAPPPRQDDLQVSPEHGPDYDAKWFRGGVTNVTHRGGVLEFEFAAGGRIHVSNPVVYVMPEKH